MRCVVILGQPEGKGDISLVDAMQPHDYSRELWRFIVAEDARRLFRSEGFGAAFAEAAERNERQLASA
jgi:hypothetical protein